jgi:hypothetical protein
MTINVYDVGDLVRVTAAFVNAAGAAADPTSVTLRVIAPSGVETSYSSSASPSEVFKSATGSYYADIDVTAHGDWHYRWEGTGAVQSSQAGQFAVAPSPFA